MVLLAVFSEYTNNISATMLVQAAKENNQYNEYFIEVNKVGDKVKHAIALLKQKI